jgi:hypothetical protein
MSECPKMSEDELEKAVDEMLDLMASEIKSGKLPMSSDAVKQRVVEILKKRGMLKGGSRTRSKKSRSRSTRRRNKRSTRRRR